MLRQVVVNDMWTILPLLVMSASVLGCGTSHEPSDDAGLPDGRTEEECAEPTRLLGPNGTWTGLERCSNGYDYYRVEARECEPYDDEVDGPCPGGGLGTCTLHAECGAGEACLQGFKGCFCSPTCRTDADCDEDEVCLCRVSARGGANLSNTCVPASCHTDADCPGGRCALSFDVCRSVRELACRGPADACDSHDDCGGLRCGTDLGHWACNDTGDCG